MSLPALSFAMPAAVFLGATLACHRMVAVRPGARAVAALGYGLCGLAALAAVCAASGWRRERIVEERRTTELASIVNARSEMDRSYVRVLRAIDAARDMACNTPPPKTTDETLLTAYTEMRTTCAFYAIVWIEAGRASDLQGVVEAADKPWPRASPPRQLWTYAPLASTAREAATLLHRVKEPPVIAPATADDRLADLLPYVLALLLALAVARVSAEYRGYPPR